MKMAGATSFEEGRGFNRYLYSARVLDAEGRTLATINHGGDNGLPNVMSSGMAAPELARVLRQLCSEGAGSDIPSGVRAPLLPNKLRITRVDSCIDVLTPFKDVIPHLQKLARDCGVSGQMIVPDDLEKGCTYYMGSPKSAVRSRHYEKGKELRAKGEALGDYSIETLRHELQCRPSGPMRFQMASMEPDDLWGATNWTRWSFHFFVARNAKAFLMQQPTKTDYDRRLAVLVQQYGKTFDEMRRREGSWDAVGDLIAELRGSAGDVVHDGVVRRPGRDVQ
jgi:hypothetical protein